MVNFAEFKKFFLFNLIGSLIICALVAVVTVLIGEFTEVTWRVLFTLAMVVIHSLVSLAFIYNDEKQNTFETLSIFTNTLFLLVVVSFLTSIFGIWKIIDGSAVWHTYQTFFIILFAALHADILSKALHKEMYIDIIIGLNYVFMAMVVIMLLPIIYLTNPSEVLGEVYYRILGATAIIDGTLSILAIIFYRLFMNKNPKVENPLAPQVVTEQGVVKPQKKGLSIWVWVLIIYLVIQILFPIIFFGARMFS